MRGGARKVDEPDLADDAPSEGVAGSKDEVGPEWGRHTSVRSGSPMRQTA